MLTTTVVKWIINISKFTHRSEGQAASASIILRTLQHHVLSVVLLDNATGVEVPNIVQEEGGTAVAGVGGWGSHD